MTTQQPSAPTRTPSAAREGANGAGPPQKPVYEVTGGPGRLSRESVHELWDFREVQRAFVRRQLKVRYKQAVVLQPLVASATFAIFLGKYANVASEGVPYFLFALAGMAGWGYFSNAASTGSESLIANQNLLRKIYFPREILPLTAVFSGLVDLAIALGVLVVATFAYGIAPALAWIALPLPVLILVLTAGAVACGLSSLNIYYRDVRYVLPFLLQLGLFASPIAYSLSQVPAGWRDLYAILNPIAAVIDAIRRTIIHGTWPDWTITFGALAWSLVLFLLAFWLFKRLERGFSDRA